MAIRTRYLVPALILLGFLAVPGLRYIRVNSLSGSSNHVVLDQKVPPSFRFVAFGDSRFHDPRDTQPAAPAIRHALVAAIDKENPAFISIGGDIVYSGENPKDWQVWDSETAIWREHKLPVYPA